MGCCGRRRSQVATSTNIAASSTRSVRVIEEEKALLASNTIIEGDHMDIITKTGEGTFRVTYSQIPDFSMDVNFFKFKEMFNLISPYVLLHWQSKPSFPRGVRRWGIYDALTDSYYGCTHQHLIIESIPKALQLDERIYNIIPAALLCFDNTNVVLNSDGKDRIIKLIPSL